MLKTALSIESPLRVERPRRAGRDTGSAVFAEGRGETLRIRRIAGRRGENSRSTNARGQQKRAENDGASLFRQEDETVSPQPAQACLEGESFFGQGGVDEIAPVAGRPRIPALFEDAPADPGRGIPEPGSQLRVPIGPGEASEAGQGAGEGGEGRQRSGGRSCVRPLAIGEGRYDRAGGAVDAQSVAKRGRHAGAGIPERGFAD